MSLFTELKRRNVFKVAIAYGAVSWLLLEISQVVLGAFSTPAWVLQVLIFFLVVGFVVAILLAWVFELGSDGLKLTTEIAPNPGIRPQTSQKLNYIISGSLAVLLVLVLVKQGLQSDESPVVETVAATALPAASEAEVAAVVVNAPIALLLDIIPDSIAVLPFANFSPDPDDAYFAAGLHDEILNQLAKIRNLKVISRQSVLRYADSELTIPEIAKELRVTNIMEGTVRYAGDRIRVTAQLIDTATDEHLWSETFDMDFKDVFEAESQIAMNVANAMQVSFSEEEQTQIEKLPTTSPEAYALYLNAIGTTRSLSVLDDATVANIHALLDRAIALDPAFALAYAAKGSLYQNRLELDLAAQFFQQARTLDPDSVLLDQESERIAFLMDEGRNAEAEPLLLELLELRPNDTRLLNLASTLYNFTGRFAEALRYGLRAVEIGPLSVNYHTLAQTYSGLRQYENAVKANEEEQMLNPGAATTSLDMSYNLAALGRLEEALTMARTAEIQMLGSAGTGGSPLGYSALIYAYSLAGSAADASRLFTTFRQMEEQADLPARARAYIGAGEYERALELLGQMATDKTTNNNQSDVALNFIRYNMHNLEVLNRPEFVEARSKL